MENLVVTSKQIAKIEWNKEQAVKEAKEIMAKYEGIIFQEEDLPEAKKEIAALRKVSKEINAQALAIDKELTAPVKQFRDEVKEVKAIVDNGIKFIDTQIQDFKEKQKEKRIIEIKSFQEWKDIADFATFDEAWTLKKWDDKSLKIKLQDIKFELTSALKSIETMATSHKLDPAFYIEKFKSLPLVNVLERISEDSNNIVVKEIVVVPEPNVTADKNEEVHTITRILKGTLGQLTALKEYADKLGVEWTK